MNPEIQEILELQRKGCNPLEQWKRIVHSPRHRDAWSALMKNGSEQIARWEKILEIWEKIPHDPQKKKEAQLSVKGLWLLGSMPEEIKDLIPTIQEKFKDIHHEEIRFALVRLLGKIVPADEEVIPLLKQMTIDPSPEVRGRALWSLGTSPQALKNESALFLRMLEDSELSVQLEAIRVLEKMESPSEAVFQALEKFINRRSSVLLQKTASHALNKLLKQKNRS